jgi:hypothetical protein
MEAANVIEAFVLSYQITLRHIPQSTSSANRIKEHPFFLNMEADSYQTRRPHTPEDLGLKYHLYYIPDSHIRRQSPVSLIKVLK